jgi:hypothetical protein
VRYVASWLWILLSAVCVCDDGGWRVHCACMEPRLSPPGASSYPVTKPRTQQKGSEEARNTVAHRQVPVMYQQARSFFPPLVA